jgi:hypothetical protein
MDRIQIISICLSLIFVAYVGRLIIKGKLREEYAIFWVICTVILILFSVWRSGLDVMAQLMGVFSPPNLVFTGFIFAIMIYLLHLSVTVSKLTENNKVLSQQIAILKKMLEDKEIKHENEK